MNDLSVFVLRAFDGSWPARVALVILARDRYEAAEKAEEFLEGKGTTLEKSGFEVAEAMEDAKLEEVYKV